jgi:hypothetical protein
MARKRIYDYVFAPGGSNTGTIKVPGRWKLSDFLAIFNTTDQLAMFNFSDSALGGTVSFSSTQDTNFPYHTDGVTTLTLEFDSSTMSAGDDLTIYVESQDGAQTVRPWHFGTDAIERMRTSEPQALIDADFEYGLQNTKWQSTATNSNVPSIYEQPGSDLVFETTGYATLVASTDTIANGSDTSVNLSNQATSGFAANCYALLVNQTNSVPTSNYLTAAITSANQRTLTLNSTTSFSANDLAVMLSDSGTGGTTVATGITSTATTSLVCAGGGVASAAIAAGDFIIVQTATSGVYEVMAVTSISTDTLTVVRQRNGSNAAGANINTSATVRRITEVEVVQIASVTNSTTMVVNRGWYNIAPQDTMINGAVIQKLSTDKEIIKLTTVSTAKNGNQTISRGAASTTASANAAASGSLVILLTGIFQAGSSTVPQIGIHVAAHAISAGGFLSTTNHVNSNSEGLYFVSTSETDVLFYYPRRYNNYEIGFPLNQYDSVLRKAAAFTGASIPLTSISSNGSAPSTITVTTPAAHGLSPGTPILVDLSAGTNQAYGEGPFTVLSIPTPTTFTYQGKSGAAVTSSLDGSVYVKPNAFFIHRPFDGGVGLGTGTPHHGAIAARQSKKYFRYQSGKAIMFTSGTLMTSTFDVINIATDGSSVAIGSTLTITTELEHNLQTGAQIKMSGVSTGGYNATYIVQSIVSDVSFTVEAQETLSSADPVIGPQPRITVTGYHGGSVKAGIFDDQNGVYWEFDGQFLNIVKRAATFQTAGLVSVAAGSNLVTGDTTTKFTEQLKVGDDVVIRGMTHTVTSITDDSTMTVVPEFRGYTNQIRVKMALVQEIRVQQSKFNVDKINGTGPSGYNIDIGKMQMLGIQYTWYGAGFVDFMVRGPKGEFVLCHRLKNNNVNDEAYFRSGNLPVRYEAANLGPTGKLASAINSSVTSLTLSDAEFFPQASVAYPVYINIDNEVIRYTGKSTNTLTGLTRAATFTQWVEGASRSFTQGIAASHAAGAGVNLLSCTSAPSLNHWGSAVLMDGGFDEDRGFSFTYNKNNYGMPNSVGQKQTVFCMRLAPSVSNTFVGDLGSRDLINRAQMILDALNIQVAGGTPRYLIEGILNPSNIDSENTTWGSLNNSSNGFQPSFTQFSDAPIFTSGSGGMTGRVRSATTGGVNYSGTKASGHATNGTSYTALSPTTVTGSGTGAVLTIILYGSSAAAYSSSNTQVTVTSAGSGYVVGDTVKILGTSLGGATTANDLTLTITAIAQGVEGGERLFAIPVSTTNQGVLDLTKVKQIGNSAIPGRGMYPNGPEVLAFQVTCLVAGTTPTADIQISYTETQA